MQIQPQGAQIQHTTQESFPSIKKRQTDFHQCKRTACSSSFENVARELLPCFSILGLLLWLHSTRNTHYIFWVCHRHSQTDILFLLRIVLLRDMAN